MLYILLTHCSYLHVTAVLITLKSNILHVYILIKFVLYSCGYCDLRENVIIILVRVYLIGMIRKLVKCPYVQITSNVLSSKSVDLYKMILLKD